VDDDLKEVRADMKAVLGDLGYLRGRAEHTPTTWVMVNTLLASQATLLGLVFAMLKLLGH
jgi:hypothetical protein